MAIIAANTKQSAFSYGEISPQLRIRRDLAETTAGVALMQNMVTLIEDVAARRPGTQFVLPVYDQAEKGRFLTFRLSDLAAYLLVFNGDAVRFFQNGGWIIGSDGGPYGIASPFAEGDLPGIRAAEDGNVLFITCAGVPGRAGLYPRTLTRFDHTDWKWAPYRPLNGPLDVQNLSTSKTIQASAVSGAIQIEASAAGILTEDAVGTIWRLDERSLDLVELWEAGETKLAIGAQRRWDGNIYEVHSPALGTAGAKPPTHVAGTISSGPGKTRFTYLHSGYGFVRIDAILSPTTAAATVMKRLPDSVVANPTYRYWEAAWSDLKGWPERVQVHQGRLWFFRGREYWASAVNDFYSHEFDGSVDGALSGLLRAPDGSLVNIEWTLASGVLVLGARDGEWLVRASNSADPVSALDIKPIADGTEGSITHIPALVDGGAVFIGRSKRRLHYVAFDRLTERLEPTEITKWARHSLRGKAAKVAYQRDPNRLLWIACENGTLRCMTFMPNDEIMAMHRHPLTNGAVEELAVLPSSVDGSDELYLLVRRTIAGATKRYIEKLTAFFEPVSETAPTASNAWFVDSGLRRVFLEPVTEIDGFEHLLGEEIALNVDGHEHTRRVVGAGGIVTLERPGQNILGGLPIDWKIRSLPIEVETQQGQTRGYKKKSQSVVVDVVESAGGRIRINGNAIEDLMLTGTADYGAPLKLFTGPIVATLEAEFAEEVAIEIFGETTMPFTLAGFQPKLMVTGV